MVLFFQLRQRDRYGHYPAHIAVKHEDLIGLQMLTSASASRNEMALKDEMEKGEGKGKYDQDTLLYLNGADVFMDKDQYNNYPLHYTAMENYPQLLDYLLSLDNRSIESLPSFPLRHAVCH